MKYNTSPFPAKRVLHMRSKGLTVANIAMLIGFSPQTVARRLREHGQGRTAARNGRVFPIDRAVIAYKAGLTVREIAKAFGYTYEPTRRHLMKAGVQRRPKGGDNSSLVYSEA